MFSLRKESGLASSHLYSEEVLENLLSYYPHGVVAIFDLELRITTIGGKILEELAYSPSRIEGRAVHELFDADGRSLIVPAFEEALEDRESSFVMRYAGRSFEVTVTPIRRNGEVQGGLAISHDISHHISEYRHLAERHEVSEYTIKEYERLLHSTFRAIEDSLLVVDSEYTVVMSNYDEHERLIEGKCHMLLHKRSAPCEECPLQGIFRSGTQVATEMSSEDGRRHSRVLMHPIFNEEGKVELAVIHMQDITPLKLNEKGLRRLNESLESKVSERTKELEQSVYQLENEIKRRKQTEEKRKELLRDFKLANRELESFSYTVSHDLQAPLRSIKGYSAVLREDYGHLLDESGYGYLERIEEAGQKMGSLIDAILTLSRIDRRELSFDRVDLTELFADSLQRLKEAEPERSVRQEIEEGNIVWGDTKLLAVLAENLVQNAWKYSSRKEHSEIRFGVIRREGKKIYYISDNGAGFDMEASQKLFQPFRRLHADQDFPGLGVGLATVRRIVLRHGGDIWAIGREGRGATFYFTIFPTRRAGAHE